jgi:hypothetical protein
MNLYREERSNPKDNAQANLCGRTHYVDAGALRFHKSRILSTHITDGGLLFALVESVALDPENRKRGYRPVIFDVFGTVIERPNLDSYYSSSKAATKAMWAALNAFDAKEHTLTALGEQKASYAAELDRLANKVAKL